MYDWDEFNIDHIQRHGVQPEETEEALADPLRIAGRAYNTYGERRTAAVGATLDGRILYVVYTLRYGKYRVITARDAEPSERIRYRRRKRW